MKKIFTFILFFIGLTLTIIYIIVGNNAPNDYGRGDVVHAAVCDCIIGIGAAFFVGAALLFIGDVLEDYLADILQDLCIIMAIITPIGSIIYGVFKTKIEIEEYDEYYESKVVAIVLYDDCENYFTNDLQVHACEFLAWA